MAFKYFDENEPYKYYIIYRVGINTFNVNLIDWEMFAFYRVCDKLMNEFKNDKIIITKDNNFFRSFLNFSKDYCLLSGRIHFNDYIDSVANTMWNKYLKKNYKEQEIFISKFINYIDEKREKPITV